MSAINKPVIVMPTAKFYQVFRFLCSLIPDFPYPTLCLMLLLIAVYFLLVAALLVCSVYIL